MELSQAHILITGGSRGLGEALADAFAVEGARLTLVARDPVRLSAVSARTGGAIEVCDLVDLAALHALVERIERGHGPVDVLVNNAGRVDAGRLIDESVESVEATIGLDLVAPIMLTRLLLPGMVSRKRGAVVMISSVGAILAAPGLSVYCASKAGMSRFVQALELELADSPVGFTLVEASSLVGGGTWDECIGPNACADTRRFMQLAYRLGLASDTDCAEAARRIVAAVKSGRSRVRLPARHRILYAVAGSPNALSSRLYRILAR